MVEEEARGAIGLTVAAQAASLPTLCLSQVAFPSVQSSPTPNKKISLNTTVKKSMGLEFKT